MAMRSIHTMNNLIKEFDKLFQLNRLRQTGKYLIISLLCVLCYNEGYSQEKTKTTPPNSSKYSIDQAFWIESSKNKTLRENGGKGFLCPYKFPDAQDAIGLFRDYSTSINSVYTIVDINNSLNKRQQLKGAVKFSGSDIAHVKDTLIIATHYSKTKEALFIDNGIVPDHANVVKIYESSSQFEPFHIDIPKRVHDDSLRYLVIQLIMKSGSKDSFYYGQSSAVLEDIHFIETALKNN